MPFSEQPRPRVGRKETEHKGYNVDWKQRGSERAVASGRFRIAQVGRLKDYLPQQSYVFWHKKWEKIFYSSGMPARLGCRARIQTTLYGDYLILTLEAVFQDNSTKLYLRDNT